MSVTKITDKIHSSSIHVERFRVSLDSVRAHLKVCVTGESGKKDSRVNEK